MSKFKEFLLTVHFDGMFPRLFFNKFVHIDTFELKEEQLHVIEYAALEQANAKIKELEAKLTNYMLGFATQTERCELLEAKLSIAVEALELLEKYKAYNGDDWVSVESKKALEKLRGEKW